MVQVTVTTPVPARHNWTDLPECPVSRPTRLLTVSRPRPSASEREILPCLCVCTSALGALGTGSPSARCLMLAMPARRREQGGCTTTQREESCGRWEEAVCVSAACCNWASGVVCACFHHREGLWHACPAVHACVKRWFGGARCEMRGPRKRGRIARCAHAVHKCCAGPYPS